MTRTRTEIEALALASMDLTEDMQEDIEHIQKDIETIQKSLRIIGERLRDLELIRNVGH